MLSLWSNFQVLSTLESFKGSSLFGQDEYKTTILILKTNKQNITKKLFYTVRVKAVAMFKTLITFLV